MKFAYCGYDFFYSCLDRLISEGHELVELFTWPTDNEYDFNDKVLAVAKTAGVRITMSPVTCEDLERLKAAGVELLVAAAYPYKIPDWRPYVSYAVNVHPSPLPAGRGPWPLPWIILKQFRESAVTIHEIDSRWDAGDILIQERFPVLERETLESLSIKSQLAAQRLTSILMRDIGALWEQKKAQGKGDYWPMPGRVDRTITWEMSIAEIDRVVRAFSKFEPFVYLDGVRHFVHKVDVWEAEEYFTPGEVVHRTNREVVYAARDGLVCLSHYVRADET